MTCVSRAGSISSILLTLTRKGNREILGQTLKGRRDQVLIASKAFFRMGPGANDLGGSRQHLIAACEASLRRLGTDYIDLYQVHWLLQRPTVSSVIVGARNEEQLRQNLDSVGWKLSPEQISKLDAASATPMAYPAWFQRTHGGERNPAVV